MATKCDVPLFWSENKELVYSYIKKRVKESKKFTRLDLPQITARIQSFILL
jgi:hypothetical protein